MAVPECPHCTGTWAKHSEGCRMARLNEAEARPVRDLGQAIGFGRLMQLAEEEWRAMAAMNGHEGSEHTTGPCAAMMVPCACRDSEPRRSWFTDDRMIHCDWCCGAGRVTKRVKAAMLDQT